MSDTLGNQLSGSPAENLAYVRAAPMILDMDPVTIFGIAALTFMLVMYALEHRGPRFVIAFAIGCALSSAYGFLSGAWPFGVVEIVWAGVAIRRFREIPRSRTSAL
jgi:hypothetical protein